MHKTSDQLTVFFNVRKESRRCPNKMLRPFAGTTLVDLCLQKYAALTSSKQYFGAHDEVFLERARQYPRLNVYRRSRESVEADSDPLRIFEILHYIPTRWVCWINPCLAFLTVNTVERAIDTFLSTPQSSSLTSVKGRRGWFYRPDGAPLTNLNCAIDTALSDELFEVAHAFHIFDRECFLRERRYWSNRPGDPTLFRIPDHEAVDIDTEDEFSYAEWLFSSAPRDTAMG